MNKAFKTSLTIKLEAKKKILSDMKRHALMSCYIKVGEPMPLNDHPLKDEIFAKIDSGEIIFS